MQLSEAKLYFFYDSNGYLTRIYHNGTNYYTATNLKGDVVAIYRHTGALWSTYEYDAWGNVISVKDANGNPITSKTHVANANPIRYRGYYYDTETELYYLQSRYYNPDIGRFLNSDNQLNFEAGMTGYNLYIYGGNNPVNTVDPTGHAFMFVTAAIGAVVGGIVGAATTGSWKGALIGAAVGGLVGLGAGAAAGAVLAGSLTATTGSVIAGASVLTSTVATSGLGAGALYIANNLTQTFNSGSDTALYSGGDVAKKMAESAGKTIDHTLLGKTADFLVKHCGYDHQSTWKTASEMFCSQASGQVNAYIYDSAYRGTESIFWQVEMATVTANSAVTEIIIHIFGD